MVFKTQLEDGASITTRIPATSDSQGDMSEIDVTDKQIAHDTSIAPKSDADPAIVKLNAMAQVVQTLVLDHQNNGPDATLALLQDPEMKAGVDSETDTISDNELAKPYLEN